MTDLEHNSSSLSVTMLSFTAWTLNVDTLTKETSGPGKVQSTDRTDSQDYTRFVLNCYGRQGRRRKSYIATGFKVQSR